MTVLKSMDDVSEKIKNKIKKKDFTLSDEERPEAIFVRSSEIPDELITPELLVIARSGTGVNTINIEKCTENGTVIFNTPGVNANAVKELVLSNLFLSVRPLIAARNMVQELKQEIDEENIEDVQKEAEKRRRPFIGEELAGKTVGILGLGEIGERVAQACHQLGMDVLGYARKFRGPQQYYDQVQSLDELLSESDFVVILLPLSDETENLIDRAAFQKMKSTAVLLNFGRAEIVNDDAVIEALDQGEIKQYISDFPTVKLLGHEKIRLFPHIGGSTTTALIEGDRIAFTRMEKYLRDGTIEEAVNFPHAEQTFGTPYRLTVFYKDGAGSFAKIISKISEAAVEIDNLTSERKAGVVYALIDVEAEKEEVLEQLTEELAELDHIIRVRLLKKP
ncbi:NAD(P)-dependent oxidoreductase [Enterococcus olivae]